LDIAQINREIRNIEEYITQNKSHAGGYYDNSSTIKGREEISASILSSVLSENPENPTPNKKPHYKKPHRGGSQVNRTNKGDQQRSANCDVGCNMF